MKEKIIGGIVGLCVGDALGVPVEFASREELEKNPVLSMRAGGTHEQPAGTWSDDTSLTLCLADSLCNGLDYTDIMQKYFLWLNYAEYTAHGKHFDMGMGTKKAIIRFRQGCEPLECGGMAENENGNGSIMRMLPLVFYLFSKYGAELLLKENINPVFDIIHNVCSLTHGHKRSHIAAGLYTMIAYNILCLTPDYDLQNAVYCAVDTAQRYYNNRKKLLGRFEILRATFL